MRLTIKGQVSIPKKIRKELNLAPGTEIEFIKDNNNKYYIKKINDSAISKWYGRIKKDANQFLKDLRS